MENITESDILLRKLESGLIDLVSFIKEHNKDKELTFDEKIDKQIKESLNNIMLGVKLKLSFKVQELRHKENMLLIDIRGKYNKLTLKYFDSYYRSYHNMYPYDSENNLLRLEYIDFSYLRVDSLLKF